MKIGKFSFILHSRHQHGKTTSSRQKSRNLLSRTTTRHEHVEGKAEAGTNHRRHEDLDLLLGRRVLSTIKQDRLVIQDREKVRKLNRKKREKTGKKKWKKHTGLWWSPERRTVREAERMRRVNIFHGKRNDVLFNREMENEEKREK